MVGNDAYSQAAHASREHTIKELPTVVDADALADMQAYTNLKERRKKAKHKKTLVFALVGASVLLLICGAIFWLLQMMSTPQDAGTVQQMATVERGEFLDTVSASGSLNPISSVSATPEVDGLVGEVFVAEGDTVAVGQKLYTIVNTGLDTAVTQAQQGINEANNSVAMAELAVRDAYRAKEQGLAGAGATNNTASDGSAGGDMSPGAPFDVGQADSAIRQAELSLSATYNTLANAQSAYDDAVARAAKRTVFSTINGSVVSVNIEPGMQLGASAGATTGAAASAPVQIADLSRMLVSVEVNEIDVLKVKVDQVATLTFSAASQLELTGTVTRIATVSSGSTSQDASRGYGPGGGGTVTYSVEILLEKPDPRLKPGMTAKATIEFNRLDSVLMLPLSAVTALSETEGSVFVLDPENPEQAGEERRVKILASNGLFVALEGAISEGDVVLLAGGGEGGSLDTGAVSEGGGIMMGRG